MLVLVLMLVFGEARTSECKLSGKLYSKDHGSSCHV